MTPLQLSIIIVNWNVRDLIRSCLRSIPREMLLRPSDYEVIVLDNASHDGSVAMLRAEFPDLALIESPVNLGFGAGCNRAFARARGRFVLLLNPDTELIDHVIDGLLAVMQAHPRAAIVAPRLVHADRSFQRASGGALPTLANVAWNYLFLGPLLPKRLAPPALFMTGDPPGLRAVEWVSGASMLIRREAVGESIFDESFFMFGEDMDVCDRVRSQGWQVLYSAPHSIVHHHGKSFDQQPAADIRASAHLGPRRVFAKRHGRLALRTYDAILLTGFAIRWPLYRVLSWLRPGAGYAERARFSRDYVLTLISSRRDAVAGPARPG
jgi:GT2 family glycosyltransferase